MTSTLLRVQSFPEYTNSYNPTYDIYFALYVPLLFYILI